MKLLMFMWDLSHIDRFIPRIKALATQDIRFTVICNVWNISTEKLHEYEKMFSIYQVNFNNYPSYCKWLFSGDYVFNQLDNGFILDDIDAVFSLSGIWFQYYSEYFARKMNVPYILFLRGDDFLSPEYQKRGKLKLWFRKQIYKNGGWNPDLCIPITKDLIPLAQKMGVPSTRISEPISGGIDLDLFKPIKRPCILVEKEHVFTVCYAGRISKEKGSEILQKVIDLTPDIRYLIAGKIQDESFIIRKNVIHLGEIAHSRMPLFYNDCDLLLMTSYTEGFPRVLIEAYACGLTVLATVGSIPRDCNVYGVSTSYKPENIAKWLNILRGSPDALRQYGESAQYYAGMFGLKRYAKEMKNAILNGVLKGTVGVI